jgi:hypothetical protein
LSNGKSFLSYKWWPFRFKVLFYVYGNFLCLLLVQFVSNIFRHTSLLILHQQNGCFLWSNGNCFQIRIVNFNNISKVHSILDKNLKQGPDKWLFKNMNSPVCFRNWKRYRISHLKQENAKSLPDDSPVILRVSNDNGYCCMYILPYSMLLHLLYWYTVSDGIYNGSLLLLLSNHVRALLTTYNG